MNGEEVLLNKFSTNTLKPGNMLTDFRLKTLDYFSLIHSLRCYDCRYWIIMATVDVSVDISDTQSQEVNIENTHDTGKSASAPTSSKKHKPEANCGARRRRNRSEVWDHFEKLEEEEDEGDVDAVTEEMTYLDLNASTSQGESAMDGNLNDISPPSHRL
ncbi:hypothetical protein Cgig2_000827 [Carnegiea gigantea]|uniref:Uncharacterized protein n=1 Tax=Carnegiea gigantea TaxID=171969 RepID=A0A9Q1KJL1_9CARY|nr:hypothetical protein Cgig2_000827 [Carnegiea gigantea]